MGGRCFDVDSICGVASTYGFLSLSLSLRAMHSDWWTWWRRYYCVVQYVHCIYQPSNVVTGVSFCHLSLQL